VDDAFSGMYRMFGTWEAFSDGQGNSGTLIWKLEHRHAYGSNTPPGSLGFELGYAGIFLPPFSDQGTRLTNLYWRQRMKGGNLVFVGGFVDVTDYMDVYMLASPWTGVTQILPPEQVTYLNVPVTKIIEITEHYGHGVGELLSSKIEGGGRY
jgi:porin